MMNDLPPGSKIVRLTIETEPKLLKKDRVTGEPCPIGRLVKRTVLTAMLGSNYANAVNKQREREDKEPDFEPRLLWKGEGEKVEGSAFLVKRRLNDIKMYLAYRQITVLDTVYTADGVVVNPDDYKNFLPVPSNKSESQDIEKEVAWRTVGLENVKSVWYADKEWI